jgi:hypothetical protein
VAALAALAVAAPAQAAPKATEVLQQFVVSGKGVDPEALARAGYDMREAHNAKKDGYLIVATPSRAAKLVAKGVSVRPLAGEQTTRKVAPPNPLQDPTRGYDVFRPWNLQPAPCPTECSTPRLPLRKWYLQQASNNADVVERVPYGKSRLGQQLAAFRVTKGGARSPQGSRPVVLYHATQLRAVFRRAGIRRGSSPTAWIAFLRKTRYCASDWQWLMLPLNTACLVSLPPSKCSCPTNRCLTSKAANLMRFLLKPKATAKPSCVGPIAASPR